MEDSLGSTIEKIKRDEEAKEAQLKAKREIEAVKAATERSIRDVGTQIKKLEAEKNELIKRTDEQNTKVTILKIRRDALAAQLVISNKEMADLRCKADLGASEIHELRSTYCEAVKVVSDECDVWALLTKPSSESVPRNVVSKKPSEAFIQQTAVYEMRIKNAKERKEKAIAERDRLKAEPDVGEEFVRIKNALRYSLEMLTNLQKEK